MEDMQIPFDIVGIHREYHMCDECIDRAFRLKTLYCDAETRYILAEDEERVQRQVFESFELVEKWWKTTVPEHQQEQWFFTMHEVSEWSDEQSAAWITTGDYKGKEGGYTWEQMCTEFTEMNNDPQRRTEDKQWYPTIQFVQEKIQRIEQQEKILKKQKRKYETLLNKLTTIANNQDE